MKRLLGIGYILGLCVLAGIGVMIALMNGLLELSRVGSSNSSQK